jgi:hypothetical protein
MTLKGPAALDRGSRFRRIRVEHRWQTAEKLVQSCRAEVGDYIDAICQAGLAECGAGPGTADCISDAGRFQCGAQTVESLRGRDHCLR